MDGGRRLLRSVDGLAPALASPRAVFAAAPQSSLFSHPAPRAFGAEKRRRLKKIRAREESRLAAFLRLPGLGSGLAIAFLAGAGLLGAMAGGQYAAFVADYGRPRDLFARTIGFGLSTVAIAGHVEMSDAQILGAAGVESKQSLLFLNADEMRRRLMALPMIKNVSVRKLFPNRLVIDITERRPYGLWQKAGAISIIGADGARIEELRDTKYESLPFVVGEGANRRIDEYIGLLNASGDLHDKIRAGILVSQRRWTLKMASGVDVYLPETNPREAVAKLARIERDARVLEKDVVSLDMRIPGKVYVRLTEEAAAAREAAKQHGKGART